LQQVYKLVHFRYHYLELLDRERRDALVRTVLGLFGNCPIDDLFQILEALFAALIVGIADIDIIFPISHLLCQHQFCDVPQLLVQRLNLLVFDLKQLTLLFSAGEKQVLVDGLNFNPQIIDRVFLVISRHLYGLTNCFYILLNELSLLLRRTNLFLFLLEQLDQVVHLLPVLFVLLNQPRILFLQDLNLRLLQFQLLLNERVDLGGLVEIQRWLR